MDLLLSSGFLAFARHLGFLDAVIERGLDVDAVLGTSSGAMVGALFVAGHTPDSIAAELSRVPPLQRLGLSPTPWRGLFSMSGVLHQLQALLPARIEDLPRPFAVGVRGPDGGHRLLTTGPLAEAVTASCAMPFLFTGIEIEGALCADGGAVDRLGVEAWRQWRPDRTALAHWVERTAGRDVTADLAHVRVIRTPRSRAKLWSLGDFAAQRAEARAQALAQLDA